MKQKFVYYWSGKRKLKTNRKGSWKLGWKTGLIRLYKKYYERSKERPTENTKTSEYQRSKEYLKEVSRKRAENRRRYGNN